MLARMERKMSTGSRRAGGDGKKQGYGIVVVLAGWKERGVRECRRAGGDGKSGTWNRRAGGDGKKEVYEVESEDGRDKRTNSAADCYAVC